MDRYDISGFKPKYVNHVWPEVSPLVERALFYSQGEYTSEDIHTYLLDGTMQLWISAKDTDLKGIVVTELLNFPNAFICQVVLVAGDAVEKWEHCLDIIELWAKDLGVDSIRAYGRPGWKPRAKQHGYEMNYCVYSKVLRTGHENTH